MAINRFSSHVTKRVLPVGALGLVLAAGSLSACGSSSNKSAAKSNQAGSSATTNGNSSATTSGGASSTSTSTSTSGGSSSSTTTATPASSGGSGSPVLAAAYSKLTRKGTMAFTLVENISADGVSLKVGANGVTSINPVRASMSMTEAEGSNKVNMQMRALNGVIYMHMPQLGSGWIKVVGAMSGATAAAANPTQSLAMLAAAASGVTKTGTVNLFGSRCTTYKANLNLSKMAPHMSSLTRSQVEKAAKTLSLTSLPVRVAIDPSGVVRQMTIDTKITADGASIPMHMTFDITKFGVPVQVAVPSPITKTINASQLSSGS